MTSVSYSFILFINFLVNFLALFNLSKRLLRTIKTINLFSNSSSFFILNSFINFFVFSLTSFSCFNTLFSVFLIFSSIILRFVTPSITSLINLLSFLPANLKIISYEALLISDLISDLISFFVKLDIFLYMVYKKV